MTIAQMKTILGYRLDDPDGARYDDNVKYGALTYALETVVGVAHEDLISGYHGRTDIVAQATGNDLPADYSRFISAYLYLTSPYRFVKKIEASELGIIDNRYTGGSNIDPLCYLWDSKFYLLVGTYSGNYNKVRMHYIKKVTYLSSSVVDPGVAESLDEAVLGLAEANLRMTYKYGEAGYAAELWKRSYQQAQQINQEYRVGEKK